MLNGDISDKANAVVAFDIDLVYRSYEEKTLFGTEIVRTPIGEVVHYLHSISNNFVIVLFVEGADTPLSAEYNNLDLLPVTIVRVSSLQQFRNILDLYQPIVCVTKLTRKYGIYKYAKDYTDETDAWRQIRSA